MADFLKDYEPVEDRLRAFWSEHPDGRVMTTLVHHADGHYIVRAEVFTGNGLDWPTASGLAHDSEDQLPPNMKTSALEVCETSAIGRALANLGYAAKGKRPSREEMSKASPAAGPAETTKPAGRATKGTGNAAPTMPAGGNQSAEGEAADGGTGGGSQTSPGATSYPVDPVDCDHHYATGVPSKVKVGGKEFCRLCGMDWVSAVEGTTADLGSAS